MARITWDRPSENFYEVGVDRGVLFVEGEDAVPWNGLTSVDQKNSGGESMVYYLDGVKVYNERSIEDFEATIEAYTYPEEFYACEGLVVDPSGLGIDNQRRKTFGLSYRTMIGDGLSSSPEDYKIHLVYNAKAEPSNKTYQTIGEEMNPSIFSWDISTSPVFVSGHRPTAHFVLDSRIINSEAMSLVESRIYGTANTSPSLPTPDTIINLITKFRGFEIYRNDLHSGLRRFFPEGYDDVKGDRNEGLFEPTKNVRLKETTNPGLYEWSGE